LRFRDLLVAAVLAVAPSAASAHPHEWIDVASEVLFDPRGQITAVRHHWRFDEAFSAFALQGLDTDGDGLYSAGELEPLAQENVQSLADFGYFTFLSAGDYQAGFSAPKDYSLELDGEFRLTLHYTLPLAQPFSTRNPVLLQVFDPEFYIAMTLPSAEAVRLVDAPPACRLTVTLAQAPDPAAAAALAEIGPEQRELPENLQELATNIENSAEIHCGGPTVAAAPARRGGAGECRRRRVADGERRSRRSHRPAGRAEYRQLRHGRRFSGRSRPAGEAADAAAQPGPPAAQASSGGFFTRVAAMQASFTRDLNAALKSLKADGTAFWWLAGVSFLYGIVHAAGPGHGKVVISSYLVANEQRLRRGVLIAFLSAAVQAVVAIGVVGIMAVLLNMTSMAITSTAGLFETGSFALVAALGLYLLATKGRQAWAMSGSPSPLWGGARGGARLQAASAHYGHGTRGITTRTRASLRHRKTPPPSLPTRGRGDAARPPPRSRPGLRLRPPRRPRGPGPPRLVRRRRCDPFSRPAPLFGRPGGAGVRARPGHLLGRHCLHLPDGARAPRSPSPRSRAGSRRQGHRPPPHPRRRPPLRPAHAGAGTRRRPVHHRARRNPLRRLAGGLSARELGWDWRRSTGS
jgi:ABC-type uncharacterized transport system substrate-binding protein